MTGTGPNSAILLRRKAAAVLNQFTRQTLGMGQIAETFHGDRDEEWAVVDGQEVKALKANQLVAVVNFDNPGQAVISIPDPWRLAAARHWDEFNPAEYGFGERQRNWRGEQDPYIVVEPVPENIPGLNAPAKPRRRHGLQPATIRVIRSLA